VEVKSNTDDATEDHKTLRKKTLERLDFDATLAEEIVSNIYGERVLDKAVLLKQTPEYQERLNRNFLAADKPADDLALKISKDPLVRKDYENAIANGIDAVSNPCKELIEFIQSAEKIPDFLDREMIELGANIFRTKLNLLTFFTDGVPAITIQAASIGIGAAAIFSQRPKGKAVSLSDYDVLGDPSLVMRFMETFKWFNKISKPGAGARFSEAFAENCRIRIIHGYVRRAITNNPFDWNYEPPVGWDFDKLGTPISGAEGCVVVTTLAAAIDAAKINNSLNISDHEVEALYQWVNYVSFMQGVPQEMLFGTAEETRVDFSAYMLSINANCHKEFTEKFYSGILNLHLETAMFPRSVALQQLIDAIIRASLHSTYGDKYCNHYSIPIPPKSVRRLFYGIKQISKGVNILSKYVPPLEKRLDSSGEYLWEDVFAEAEVYLKQHFGATNVVSGTDNAYVKDASST